MVGCVWAGNYETNRKILCISFHKNSKGEIRNCNKVFVLVIEKLVFMIYFEFRASDFVFSGQAQTLTTI